MRDYLKRLDRLEGGPGEIAPDGLLITRIIVSASNGASIPWEEPITAESEGETINRKPGEGKEAFLKRVEDAFHPPPGEVRQAIIHQGKPPKI